MCREIRIDQIKAGLIVDALKLYAHEYMHEANDAGNAYQSKVYLQIVRDTQALIHEIQGCDNAVADRHQQAEWALALANTHFVYNAVKKSEIPDDRSFIEIMMELMADLGDEAMNSLSARMDVNRMKNDQEAYLAEVRAGKF